MPGDVHPEGARPHRRLRAGGGGAGRLPHGAGGETVAIFGANGSGKTTFLKAVAGMVPATRGKVAWRGEDVTALPAHERAARGCGTSPTGRGWRRG